MMTPDELHAKGYHLEVAAWGVRIIYEPVSTSLAVFSVHFPDGPVLYDEGCRRGWAAAEVDFVKRRLS